MIRISPILGLMAISLTLQAAPTRPVNKPDSLEEIRKKLALNEKVVCTVQGSIFKVDSNGNQTGETVELKLFEGKPERSSSVDLATYLINYDDDKISFRYAMNTQSGLIEVTDKKSGANANIDLRIDDLVTKPHIIGAILIENNKKLKLLGVSEPVHLRAECSIRN